MFTYIYVYVNVYRHECTHMRIHVYVCVYMVSDPASSCTLGFHHSTIELAVVLGARIGGSTCWILWGVQGTAAMLACSPKYETAAWFQGICQSFLIEVEVPVTAGACTSPGLDYMSKPHTHSSDAICCRPAVHARWVCFHTAVWLRPCARQSWR